MGRMNKELVVMNLMVELLIDTQVALGEGPIWDERRQLLYWVDILGGKLFAYDPAGHENRAYDIGQYVGTVVPAESDDKVLLAVYEGFAVYDLQERELRLLSNPEAHLPQNRFNDGKCDPNGRFWAGTMAMHDQRDQGSLYCMDRDFSVRKVLGGIGISNGLAWSLDGRVMYFIDSTAATITAFDFAPETGALSNERLIVEVPGEMGTPDGMTIDEEGLLWVAHWGGGRVCRWDPQNGRLLAQIDLPVSQVTACTFGGPQLDTLYITSARSGLKEAQLRQEPQAGSIFAVKPGPRGLPALRFAGVL
jgi:sugar lactone lactonase YvrE